MNKNALLLLFVILICHKSVAVNRSDTLKRKTAIGFTVYNLTYMFTPSHTLYEGKFESLRSGFPVVAGLSFAYRKVQVGGGIKLPMFTTAKFKFGFNAEVRYLPEVRFRKLRPHVLINADLTRYENNYALVKLLISPAGPELYAQKVENNVRLYNLSAGVGVMYRVERMQKGTLNLFADVSAGAFTKDQHYVVSDHDAAVYYNEETFSRYYFSVMAKAGVQALF